MVNGLKLNAFVDASLPTVDLCKDPDDKLILAIALVNSGAIFGK